ncbi:MAG: dUTP diphosphatase [Betaproteobacteria bacterium]|jgi:dUTP pyrophosphatase
MKVKRLHKDAILPTKAHSGDLGYDLYASEDVLVGPNQVKLVPCGIALGFPTGYGGLIKDRSSVSTKLGLFTVAGVIDNGYTGEIKVAMFNSNEELVKLNKGDKIAQIVLVLATNFTIEEVDDVETADGRGDKGFGSTGV